MNWSLVLLAWASTGCIPLHPTVREARSGVILDAETGAPVVGATVRVESYFVHSPGGLVTPLESAEIKTDPRGRWAVTSAHEWTIGILAADGMPLYADVYCVLADGYLDEVRNPYLSWVEREASVADGREISPVLLLAPQAPQSSRAENSPAAKRSCIQTCDLCVPPKR